MAATNIPQLVYAAATRLGGVGLANVVQQAVVAAYRAQMLQKAIVYGYKPTEIPTALIKNVWLQPTKLFSGLPARYYYSLKRMYLDYITKGYLARQPPEIFHGWTHECWHSLKTAKQHGAIALLERNYCHPCHSQEMLAEEYRRRGQSWPPPPFRLLRAWDHWHREVTTALEECQSADYILVPSEFTRQTFLERGYPPEKLVLLPRGVDVSRFRPQPSIDRVFRVLFVGQLCFRKGVPYLLEAWQRLGFKNAELVLAGSVHEEIRPLLAHYEGEPGIKIEGFVSDPVRLYNNSTVFCFPSLDEGSAKVTYEAMASGLPVIVTPEAGSVARHGIEGLIVPSQTVEPLMASLSQFYEDRGLAAEMGLRARHRAEQFTWEHYRAGLVYFYRRVSGIDKIQAENIADASPEV
ncbi:MAG: glycosyltransferase family 4 protein [Deltaproteobacteria bacterium]|nr:glycosyltransferase family 4 protein [Deltaproteobacteria bacterium]MBW1953511.1 glycosyltransferase family 4 protein [Deltaproteobacteria bacterium]MBW1987204.1 glycosyltransferase family 4 protein [Deltaproteobacteria bacterium]MBW2134316.1 glycosyltransferase family 4 protein [Deltaproteobacteria bacterium]